MEVLTGPQCVLYNARQVKFRHLGTEIQGWTLEVSNDSRDVATVGLHEGLGSIETAK